MKTTMSKSQYYRWMQCPAREYAVQAGEYPEEPINQPMALGGYVDRALTNPEALDEWTNDPEVKPLLFNKSGKPAAKTAQADKMIERIKTEPTAQKLFYNDQMNVEPQKELHFELASTTWIGHLDAVIPDAGVFVELKVTGQMRNEWVECDDGKRRPFPWYIKYWDEMALYWMAFHQNYETQDHAGYLIVGLLSDSPAIRCVEFDSQNAIERRLHQVAENTQTINQWKNGDIEPPPCMETDCPYCNERVEMPVEKAIAHF